MAFNWLISIKCGFKGSDQKMATVISKLLQIIDIMSLQAILKSGLFSQLDCFGLDSKITTLMLTSNAYSHHQ